MAKVHKPAFVIIGDNVNEPLVARAYVRKEGKGLGRLRLAEAFKDKGSTDEAISMRDFFPDRAAVTLNDGASFPDDSALLMIGNTQELLDACKEAEDAHILAIYTKTRRPLTLLYARIKVSSFQTDTLIAIGQKGLLPSPPQNGWREYKNAKWQSPSTYVTTPNDSSELYSLPPIIRWIKENDDEAWL